jgi:hypothetical protein
MDQGVSGCVQAQIMMGKSGKVHIHGDDDQAANCILRETQGNKCTKYAVAKS